MLRKQDLPQKVDYKASGTNLVTQLYLSGVWLGVDLRTDTRKAPCVYKGLDYVLKFGHHPRLNYHYIC